MSAVPVNRGQWPSIAVLAALAALATLSTNILLPSFPAIASGLGVPLEAMGATLSAFFLPFALAQLVVGPLADRYGRRPVVVAGVASLVAGSALCALAPDFATLLAGRVVQAVGAAATSVCARAVARDRFEGPALAAVMSAVMVVMAAAPGFAPLLGGALDASYGWRSVFVVVAAAAALVGLGHRRWLGETLAPSSRRSLSPATIAAGYLDLARERAFSVPAVAVALTIGALFGFFAATPRILAIGHGLGPRAVGVFFAATVLVVFAAGAVAPRLARRLGPERAVATGLAIGLAGGVAMLAAGAVGIASLAGFVAPVCVFLFGMGIVNPVGTAVALAPAGARAGQASSLLGFLQMTAAAAGAALAAALPGPPLFALGEVVAVAMGVATLLYARRGRLPVPAGAGGG